MVLGVSPTLVFPLGTSALDLVVNDGVYDSAPDALQVTVEDTLQLKSGESILVQGGAGGVAGMAIQIAKHLVASVKE